MCEECLLLSWASWGLRSSTSNGGVHVTNVTVKMDILTVVTRKDMVHNKAEADGDNDWYQRLSNLVISTMHVIIHCFRDNYIS